MAFLPAVVIDQILVPSLLTLFFIGGIFGFLVGIGLLLRREPMLRMFDVMNRWVSFRETFKPMAIPRDSWPTMERYRRELAIALILAASFAIYTLLFSIDLPGASRRIAEKTVFPPDFVAWVLGSTIWFLAIGNAVAIAIGIMLWFFPDVLASIEKISARWISTRGMTRNAEAMQYSIDTWGAASPRTAGMIIAALSVTEVISISKLLF